LNWFRENVEMISVEFARPETWHNSLSEEIHTNRGLDLDEKTMLCDGRVCNHRHGFGILRR